MAEHTHRKSQLSPLCHKEKQSSKGEAPYENQSKGKNLRKTLKEMFNLLEWQTGDYFEVMGLLQLYEFPLLYKETNKIRRKKPTNTKVHIVICADSLAPNKWPELSATPEHSPVGKPWNFSRGCFVYFCCSQIHLTGHCDKHPFPLSCPDGQETECQVLSKCSK